MLQETEVEILDETCYLRTITLNFDQIPSYVDVTQDGNSVPHTLDSGDGTTQ
jgi:hypothetical protein